MHAGANDAGLDLQKLETEIAAIGCVRTHDLLTMLAQNHGVQGNVSRVLQINAESEAAFGKPVVDLPVAVVRAHLARHDFVAAVDYAEQVSGQTPHAIAIMHTATECMCFGRFVPFVVRTA